MGNMPNPLAGAVAAANQPVKTGEAGFKIGLKLPVTALMRMRAGARWFYWVAGLSLINTLMAFGGGRVHFVLGLGATQLVDAIAKRAGATATIPAAMIDCMMAAAFVGLGAWASRCNQFAFGMGMLLYAGDAALLVVAHDWLSVAFHGLALFYMYRGFAAAQELRGIADLNQAGVA